MTAAWRSAAAATAKLPACQGLNIGCGSSCNSARLGATASAARLTFDKLTLESFIWESTMRAAHAVAPNLPPPTDERPPVRGIKPLEHSTYRRRRRGTPPRRDAGCGSQWCFLHCRACAHQEFPSGSICCESTIYWLKNFPAMGV